MMSSPARILSLLLTVLLLGACGESPAPVVMSHPVAFAAGDECHVCGMSITKFPGPKGEVIGRQGQVVKFCSVAELLGWWSQEENRLATQQLFVHDMAYGDWHRPDDAHLIDASQAWFVFVPGLPSAMGGAIATFADEENAKQFANEHHAEVLRLADITPVRLQQAAAATSHVPDAHAVPKAH